jgi:hypothetical protein
MIAKHGGAAISGASRCRADIDRVPSELKLSRARGLAGAPPGPFRGTLRRRISATKFGDAGFEGHAEGA